MSEPSMAVMGMGATGAVLAAALLAEDPDTLVVGHGPAAGRQLTQNGIKVGGALDMQATVKNFAPSLKEAQALPQVILIATKTFHLDPVLDQIAEVYQPGMLLVSTHNGLGTEDLIAERFGRSSAARMSLNYGVAQSEPGQVHVAFFNKPNPLGCLDPANREITDKVAAALTKGGLDTEQVDDIKLLVWKKMIMKCTMASICAITDRTITGCLEYPPTREIAEGCLQEILAVAKATGYDLGDDYYDQAMGYLAKVGAHKDSMCVDVANRTRTEIDFLGGKVLEYAEAAGLDTPYYRVMTNLVRSLEDSYLEK